VRTIDLTSSTGSLDGAFSRKIQIFQVRIEYLVTKEGDKYWELESELK
jgi:hypothetical protein